MAEPEEFRSFVESWFPGASGEALTLAASTCALVMNDPLLDPQDGPIEVLMRLIAFSDDGDQLAKNLLRNIRKEH